MSLPLQVVGGPIEMPSCFQRHVAWPLKYRCFITPLCFRSKAPSVCTFMLAKRFKVHWKAEEAAGKRLPSISTRKQIIVVYIFPRITVAGLLPSGQSRHHSHTDYSGWQINLDVIAILIPQFSCLRAQWGLLTKPSLLSLPLASFCFSVCPLSCRSGCTTGPILPPNPTRLALGSTAKCFNGARKREGFQRGRGVTFETRERF